MRPAIVFFLLHLVALAGAQNKYGINAISLSEYKSSVKTNPEKELVDLDKSIPGILLDIRYATSNNFTGKAVYRMAKAYARKPVAAALAKAQQEFEKLGYRIKIYDSYRPYSATVKFYELMKGDTTYVASPYKGSRHNRGCAVDMTIVEKTTGEELQMPSAYDAMQKESWPSTPVADPQVRNNRDILIQVMEKNGFKVYTTEWWHFDFIGWEKFEVMNVDFENLENN
ncbi:MAG TPA: M15 family metallopeptidase [Cyclobacteriaceae bacterium]|jgi:D-alanyl-D-alanine dipeptidase|nr:M15 family metallopeptidase [Cyclobacteriaceae bacterium]